MQRILFSLCLLSLWGSAYSSDMSGSANLAGIERYPNADIVRHSEGKKVNYPLVASAIKKVNGVVRADEEQRLDGAWRRVIYLMPDGHGSDASFRYFSDRLEKLGVKTLYSCEGRHCGPSNLWANKVFEEANLYGLDKDQFYLLGARTVDSHTEYYVLYTVRRGNKRVYAMLDQLIVEGVQERAFPTAPSSDDGLKASGMEQYWDVVVQPETGTIARQAIDKILAHLQQDSTTTLLLAGSVPFDRDLKLDQQIERSRQYGQALKDRLIEENVADERLFVIGTGPLLQETATSTMPFVRVMRVQ
ncbi:DUF4892 domain-containing protein [Kistimonas asteriae]|uniref:DUF4892 domain-containing protein n=1 Tax=Kistimonas asteriae TaxID=517724 RepID=UPI001BAAC576|nr:DUF4892 domain-containing protein [Kistimonas asteriae]